MDSGATVHALSSLGRVLWRAALIWFALAIAAIVCGILRQALLAPRVGEQAAHVVGTLTVCALFAAILRVAVPWVAPGWRRKQRLGLGAGWCAATIAFEFGFGHYIVGHPWTKLLADYNLFRGRLWVLVLLTLLLAPPLAARRRSV